MDRHIRHYLPPPDLCVIAGANSSMRSMSLRLIKMFIPTNLMHLLIQTVTVCTSLQPNIEGI